MADSLTPEERYEIITRGLAEVVGGQDLLALLKEGKHPKVYWGTATTGKPHFGYMVPMSKIGDFLRAGCEVTILLADIHGFLDNLKSTWEVLQFRTVFYKFILTEMLKVLGVPLDKLKFVQGRDYQLSPEYTLDVYKMSTKVTSRDTIHAGAEVVKQVEHPLMSNLLYPILQALDEQYLGVDIQFGGVDQRKIFMFARDNLPKIDYKKRIHLMNPLIPGLGESGKMSSSEPLSKVDFDDTDEQVKSKFKQAFSVDGKPERADGDLNGLLSMLKFVVFPRILSQNRKFVVKRPAKFGGDITYASFQEVYDAFKNSQLASADLKPAVADEVLLMTKPLRDAINKNLDKLHAAYPETIAKKPAAVAAPTTEATIASFDLRVGKIVEIGKHPNADSLYVEKIDLGEAEPRTVVSGLVKFVPMDELKDKLVIVVCNLPAAPLRGVVSQGMILAASEKGATGDLAKVVPLYAPEGSKVGEKLLFPDFAEGPDPQLSSKRQKRVLEGLKTNADGVAVWLKKDKEFVLQTSAGKLVSPVKNGSIA